jgi:hypothetical protein
VRLHMQICSALARANLPHCAESTYCRRDGHGAAHARRGAVSQRPVPLTVCSSYRLSSSCTRCMLYLTTELYIYTATACSPPCKVPVSESYVRGCPQYAPGALITFSWLAMPDRGLSPRSSSGAQLCLAAPIRMRPGTSPVSLPALLASSHAHTWSRHQPSAARMQLALIPLCQPGACRPAASEHSMRGSCCARRSPRSGDCGGGDDGAGASARRSMSQETSASGWSAWSTEDSEGESSAHKRRRFQLLRKEHYDMRQALAKCACAVSPGRQHGMPSLREAGRATGCA